VKKMMKITIDRNGCIGCGACWAICPEVYEPNADDAKSRIVEKFQVSGNCAEGQVEEKLAECAHRGADGYPVQVISIE
jgi:Ferredoxin